MSEKIETQYVFPIPIRKYKMSTLNKDRIDEIIKFINKDTSLIEKGSLGSHSVTQDFLKKDIFKDISKEILDCVNYFSLAEGHKCKDIRIASSWVNKLKRDQYIHPHGHPNSYISGTIHLTKGAELIFQQPHVKEMYHISIEDRNSLEKISISSEPGNLILFPSKLIHSVNMHKGYLDRYSIAFNTMPMIYGPNTSFVNLTEDIVTNG